MLCSFLSAVEQRGHILGSTLSPPLFLTERKHRLPLQPVPTHHQLEHVWLWQTPQQLFLDIFHLFLFLPPFIVPRCMLSRFSVLCCISSTWPARQERASASIVWLRLWPTLRVTQKSLLVCDSQGSFKPLQHSSVSLKYCLPSFSYLILENRWLYCEGHERYGGEIHWKINYFIPKWKGDIYSGRKYQVRSMDATPTYSPAASCGVFIIWAMQ